MNGGFSAVTRRPTRFLSSICPSCARHLSSAAVLRSGHNKWSTIKHDKARNDASRSKQRGNLAKDIADASRLLGADPIFNPRLADAIATAKRAGMPKAGIEAAVARGQGRTVGGAALEHVLIEAVVPPVALIVDCQTDSKMRTLKDLRAMLKERGGTATPTSYLFEKRGRLVFHAKEGTGVDEVLEVALDAAALDVAVDDEGRIVVDTEPSALKEVEKRITGAMGLEVMSSESVWHPNSETRVESNALDLEPLKELGKLQEELQKVPEVQGVYMNLDLEAAFSEMNTIDAIR